MERLKMMKEQLMTCVQGELGNLSQADTTELGDAIDMIKDLSEAIYYCTVTEAMEKNEEKEKYYPTSYNYRDMDKNMGRMYYDASERGNNARGGGTRGYPGGMYYENQDSRYYPEGMYYERQGGNNSRNYPMMRDYNEGRSPMTRKSYMERKMHGGDKNSQMRELDKYMQELSQDLSEMIEGSSPEEKQMLQQKLSTLASKVV